MLKQMTGLLKPTKKIPEKGNHIEPIHHYHVRKRVHHWFESYPHPHFLKRWVDRGVYFVGVVGPIMTLPQLYTVWFEQNTSGVSVTTWASYAFMSSFWLLYGMVHQERPIMIIYGAWIVIHSLMVVGILMYS
jgi:uncharacterized protein with PQ loop repeat